MCAIDRGRKGEWGDLSVIPNALYTFMFFCCCLCLCKQTCNFLSDLTYAIVSSRIFLDIMWAVVVFLQAYLSQSTNLLINIDLHEQL